MTYKELYEKRRVMYASQYELAVAEGNMKKAYEILGTLMRFHFIDENDVRLSKKNFKIFEDAGVRADHRFSKDYRKTTDFLPDNLFFTVPNSVQVDLVSEKHWGKRVELVYEGDIIVPDKTYSFFIREQSNAGSAKKAINGFKSMYKTEAKAELNVNWEESILSGNSKIYEITLGNNQQFMFSTLGYVHVILTKNLVRMTVLLSNSNMIKTHINIKKAYESVSQALKVALIDCGVDSEIIEVKYLCDIKKARSYQANLYSKEPPLDYDKFCEIENRKIAAAKEAEQAE